MSASPQSPSDSVFVICTGTPNLDPNTPNAAQAAAASVGETPEEALNPKLHCHMS